MLKAGTAARRRSFRWPQPLTPADAQAEIATLLRAIDARLQPAKADWVGHIKIMLSSGAETTYGSVTAADDPPHWAGALATPLSQGELTVYAAIYALSDAQVAQAVDAALAGVGDQGSAVS